MWASNWETVVYKRDTLYEEVWSAPVRDVAKRYGISDVALAKMCRKLGVPVPGRGYWARKAAGNPPPRTPLPALKAGMPNEIRFQRRRREAAPPMEEAQTKAVAQERDPSQHASVPESLDHARPMLSRVPAITSDTVRTPSSPRVRATGSRRLGHDFAA